MNDGTKSKLAVLLAARSAAACRRPTASMPSMPSMPSMYVVQPWVKSGGQGADPGIPVGLRSLPQMSLQCVHIGWETCSGLLGSPCAMAPICRADYDDHVQSGNPSINHLGALWNFAHGVCVLCGNKSVEANVCNMCCEYYGHSNRAIRYAIHSLVYKLYKRSSWLDLGLLSFKFVLNICKNKRSSSLMMICDLVSIEKLFQSLSFHHKTANWKMAFL